MITVIIDNTWHTIPNGAVFAIAAVYFAIVVAFYVLRSIGIYKLALGAGVRNAWFAFIPCLWMWTACKIIGNTKFFGKPFGDFAVWFFVIFSFATVLPLTYNILRFAPLAGYFLQGGDITFSITQSGAEISTVDFVNPLDVHGVKVFLQIIYFINYFLRIAEIFITVTVYVNLFRKFWPQHYILAAVLSFMGLFGPFVFAIRNNKEVNYADYLRSRFGAGFNPYGPYGFYGRGGQNAGDANGSRRDPFGEFSEREDEPFGEYSDAPEEPFGEYSDGKDKRDGDDN